MVAQRHSAVIRGSGGNPMLGRADRVIGQPPGRVCAAPGCATILSVYNASELCSLHEPWTRRPGTFRS